MWSDFGSVWKFETIGLPNGLYVRQERGVKNDWNSPCHSPLLQASNWSSSPASPTTSSSLFPPLVVSHGTVAGGS